MKNMVWSFSPWVAFLLGVPVGGVSGGWESVSPWPPWCSSTPSSPEGCSASLLARKPRG
jgi:hypothetical protein